jgi:4-hydroxybenzoate polyprenyltransferase
MEVSPFGPLVPLVFNRTKIPEAHAKLNISDWCDQDLDKQVDRCKVRPLPSGMLTSKEAIGAFIAWIPVMIAITYYTLGTTGVITFTPIWILSLIYPLLKRFIHFPQILLGAIIGAAVFPGWTSITGDFSNISQAVPLFAATMSWVVYFDIFYAMQVSHKSPISR